MSASASPCLEPRKCAWRIAALEMAANRSVADDDGRARQIEAKQRFEVLFHRHPSDRQEDRPRQVERALGPRAVDGVVDAASPEPDPGEAAASEIGADRRRRRHHRSRRRMKIAQAGIGQPFGNADPRRHIFGEAGVVAGGEDPLVGEAIATRQPADRAFGGDMDMVGLGFLDAPADLSPGRDREANFRVGGQGSAPHALRREEFKRRAQFGGRLAHSLQSRHHAIDLRAPGVGGDQDTHQANSACASSAPASVASSSNDSLSSAQAASCSGFFQRNTSICPS